LSGFAHAKQRSDLPCVSITFDPTGTLSSTLNPAAK
jgi:hypothetical protein